MNKLMKKAAQVMAAAALHTAKNTTREVSKDFVYQPKRPAMLDKLTEKK